MLSHQGLIGLDPETGRLRPREAQTYPPPFCELIATMFINALEMRSPRCPDLEEEENDELNNVEGKFVDPEVGDRAPVPEVAVCLGEIERWKETARWTWRKAEHNNVLEGRAGLAAVGRLATDPDVIDQRALVISDSQVVIGAMSKGRSSIHIINYLRSPSSCSSATRSRDAPQLEVREDPSEQRGRSEQRTALRCPSSRREDGSSRPSERSPPRFLLPAHPGLDPTVCLVFDASGLEGDGPAPARAGARKKASRPKKIDFGKFAQNTPNNKFCIETDRYDFNLDQFAQNTNYNKFAIENDKGVEQTGKIDGMINFNDGMNLKGALSRHRLRDFRRGQFAWDNMTFRLSIRSRVRAPAHPLRSGQHGTTQLLTSGAALRGVRHGAEVVLLFLGGAGRLPREVPVPHLLHRGQAPAAGVPDGQRGLLPLPSGSQNAAPCLAQHRELRKAHRPRDGQAGRTGDAGLHGVLYLRCRHGKTAETAADMIAVRSTATCASKTCSTC